MRDEKDLRWTEQDSEPVTETWYVVLPFASRESAELAAGQVLRQLGYGSSLTSATEDDPAELPGVPFFPQERA